MSSGATRTLFITPAYLKENTVIDSNAEDKLLNKSIRTAEDKYLMPIIGTYLYEVLITKVLNGTLTGDYKTLMDSFVYPCLMEYSLYEYIPFTAFKFKNKGPAKPTDPNSETPSLKDLSYLRDNVMESAQFYGERLIKHLRANETLFPEYRQWRNMEDVPPASTNISVGIHFPKLNNQQPGYGKYGSIDLN